MRILWLLNHTTAREFEVPIMRDLGIEVYAPKLYPHNIRSSSIDLALDAHLTIPKADLAALNAFDFYADHWPAYIVTLINRHFDIAMVSAYPYIFDATLKYFRKQILLRAYGIVLTTSNYGRWLSEVLQPGFERRMASVQDRFHFSQAFPHLHEIETGAMRASAVFMPIGIPERILRERGTYERRTDKVVIVLPDIHADEPSRQAYQQVKRHFSGIDKVILGAQSTPVNDPEVKNFLPNAEFDLYMKGAAAMFYQSVNARHLHYHPLEAMTYGMPVICLEGGMIPHLFDRKSPATAADYRDARRKLKQLVKRKTGMAEAIVTRQKGVVAQLTPEACLPDWRRAFETLAEKRRIVVQAPRRQRIAVFLDAHTLVYFADAVVEAVKSVAAGVAGRDGVAPEIVWAVPASEQTMAAETLGLAAEAGMIRPYTWRNIDAATLTAIMNFAGVRARLHFGSYAAPYDGISCFDDCSLHVYALNRIAQPLAPVKPYLLFCADLAAYGKQGLGVASAGNAERTFIAATAKLADGIIVPTAEAAEDVAAYLTVPPANITILEPGRERAGISRLVRPVAKLSSHARGPVHGVWLAGPDLVRDVRPFSAMVRRLAERFGAAEMKVIGHTREALASSVLPWLHVGDGAVIRQDAVAEGCRLTVANGEMPRDRLAALLAQAHFCIVTDRTIRYLEVLGHAHGAVYLADNRYLEGPGRAGWHSISRVHDQGIERIFEEPVALLGGAAAMQLAGADHSPPEHDRSASATIVPAGHFRRLPA